MMSQLYQTESTQLTKPFLAWDTYDFLISETKYLLEIGEVDDEDEAFEIICKEYQLWDFVYWITFKEPKTFPQN